MSLVMIVFELVGPQRSTKELDNILNQVGNPCHVMNNARVVQTDKDPSDVFDLLKNKVLQSQDRCLVASLTKAWEGQNCQTFGKCYE